MMLLIAIPVVLIYVIAEYFYDKHNHNDFGNRGYQ